MEEAGPRAREASLRKMIMDHYSYNFYFETNEINDGSFLFRGGICQGKWHLFKR